MATMTNAQIIFDQRVNLMNDGIIGTTGRKIRVAYTDDAGEIQEMTINEPEELHTFHAWKERGFIVQKGEKALARFSIWNYTTGKKGKNKEAAEEEQPESLIKSGYYYMKEACFFAASQVAPLEEKKPETAPEKAPAPVPAPFMEKLLPVLWSGKMLPAVITAA